MGNLDNQHSKEGAGGISRWAMALLLVQGIFLLLIFVVILSGVDNANGEFWDNVHWTSSFIVAAILAWMGVREASPENFWPRRWLALGLTANALGQILWNLQMPWGEPPVPNIADPAFLTVGVCFVAGFFYALQQRSGAVLMRWAILDSAALSVAMVSMVLAVYLPYLGSISVLQLIVLGGYPASLLSAACVGIIVILALEPPPDRRWMLFTGALLVYGVLWNNWNILALSHRLENGSTLNMLFSVTVLTMGAGAMIWDTDGLPNLRWNRACRIILRMLPLFLVTASVGTVVFSYTQSRIPESVQYAIGIGAFVVIILAMIRQSFLLLQTDNLLAAEQLAKEREQKHRILFETARDAIFTIEDGRIQDCNKSALRLFACDIEDILGRGPEDFSPEKQPDGRSSEEKTTENEVSALAGYSRMFDWRFRRQSGVEFDAEVSLNRIDLADKVLLLAVVRDLSERRQVQEALHMSDQKFSIAFEQAPIGKALVAPDGKWLKVNRALRESLGYTWEELAEKSFQEITHPDDLEEDLARVQEVLDGKKVSYQMEKRYFHKDGRIVPVLLSVSLVRDPRGQPLFFISQIQDITQRKQLEEQFRQAQKMEAMGTLAGGIAHDFNNILAAINGYAELSRMAASDRPDAVKYLDSVLKAGTRAAELVRQILAFSRHQGATRVPVNLSEVIDDALKLLRATIPSTIEFKIELDHGLPPVLADATQVHQIMMNLGTNAWHAMKDRPGVLEIILGSFEVDQIMADAQIHLQPGPYARVLVRDTGKGMNEATKTRIFEPFYTTKAPGEGTGLGLSVVHGIMQSHEGAIQVYSQPGEGTVFHLYFPLYKQEVLKQETKVAQVPKGNGESILFVDDEPSLVELGKKVLELVNYRVTACVNVVEALEMIRARPGDYDLVITDYSMPKMTGVEFASRISALRKDLPIILTTGYAPTLTMENMKENGIRDLLLKPLSLQSLSLAVHEALSKNRGVHG